MTRTSEEDAFAEELTALSRLSFLATRAQTISFAWVALEQERNSRIVSQQGLQSRKQIKVGVHLILFNASFRVLLSPLEALSPGYFYAFIMLEWEFVQPAPDKDVSSNLLLSIFAKSNLFRAIPF